MYYKKLQKKKELSISYTFSWVKQNRIVFLFQLALRKQMGFHLFSVIFYLSVLLKDLFQMVPSAMLSDAPKHRKAIKYLTGKTCIC